MCGKPFIPVLVDDLLMLLISFVLFLCSVFLYSILVKKKSWDIGFWLCFSAFLLSLGGYGHVTHHIYMANAFSYDGFISGAAFITICGLLFSKRKYIKFSDSLKSKKAPLMFATFLAFAFIFLLTTKYKNDCFISFYDLFINILETVVYPLLLLFGISTFLYRFSICLSVFAVSLALFLVQNFTFIANALIVKDVVTNEMLCSFLSLCFNIAAIYILTRAKRIYKERLNG
jgi:hypothetical protein